MTRVQRKKRRVSGERHRSGDLSRPVRHGWDEIHRARWYYLRHGKGGKIKVRAAVGGTFRAVPGSLQFLSWKDKWLRVCELEELSTKQCFKIDVRASRLHSYGRYSTSPLNAHCSQFHIMLMFYKREKQIPRRMHNFPFHTAS